MKQFSFLKRSSLFLSAFKVSSIILSIAIATVANSQTYYGNGLPYINTLNSNNGLTVGGTAVVNSPNGVQLTSNTNSQAGSMYLTNTNLQTTNGLHVEFEYSSNPNASSGADGICLILYNGNGNGTASAFNLGASGAGLGYTYSRTSQNGTAGTKGVANGYLGLGLDEFGNYKTLRSVGSPAEYREGINIPNWATGGTQVTLRGPGNPSTANSGNIAAWYSGYPVLYTTTTQNTGTGVFSASLNPATGAYSTSTSSTLSNGFYLGTNSATPTWDPTNANYRKVFLDLVPIASANSYMIVTRIQHGTVIDTVINKYMLPVGNITAIDNAASPSITNTINAVLPTTLNIAFTASTGGFNNNHYVRLLSITTPYAAGAKPDTLFVCNNALQASYTIATIFNNDSAYTGSLTATVAPTSSSNNIDPTSFVFSTDSTSVPAGFNTIAGNTVTATTTDGTWVFNTTTKVVTFTPAANNTTNAGKIFYSIKGNTSPYSNEAYRSIGASINAVPVAPPPAITTTQSNINSNSGHVGGTYNIQIQPVGGSGLTYTATGLPASLTISSTGVISGNAPSQQGYYPFTVTLTNAAGCTTSQSYYITNYAALPVQYSVPLEATVVNNSVRLNWQTATESNNKYFIVQRSVDQATWQSIDTVYSFFPNGTGNGHAYSSLDKNPLNGYNSYRLQQVDISNNIAIGTIVTISFGKKNTMYISPNPTNGSIKIYNLPTSATVRIISVNGGTYTLPVNNGVIDVSSLASGIYFAQVTDSNSIISTLKFIKQ